MDLLPYIIPIFTAASPFAVAIAENIAANIAADKIIRIFKSRNKFVKQLGIVIESTIIQFEKKYPAEKGGGEYPFYKSQSVMDELLKYSFLSTPKVYDLEKII